MTDTATSADGTKIAYDRTGEGPALILIGGALSGRHGGAPLAAQLTSQFSVVTVDRRGRGDSGDTPPYLPAREVEDLTAVIEANGGSAHVYGHSSGGVLALEAAAAGAPITKLAVYEPPYLTRDPVAPEPTTAADVQSALDGGDPGAAVEIFMRSTGAPWDPAMKETPWWPALLGVAHTLPYDLALVGDGQVPAERLAKVSMPILGLYGGDSPAWAHNAIAAVTAAIPGARQVVVEGQTHAAAPEAVAPIIIDFFK
ncbi:MAG: alpha/beta hydrolase [Candidatus Dormibacteraeota bacterium]|nr:alpha/beta hydrolase [Candidatus Dormibacteraeota bacterium]